MGYYKYTSNKYMQQAILHGVYASKLQFVNDPYEMEGIRYKEDYRICCMTSSPRKMIMWAYYTNHRGCCIEYEIPSDLVETRIVRPVDYTEEYTEHRTMCQDDIIHSLYTKGKEWQEEKELRAVWHKKDKPDCWEIADGEIYLKAKVISVNFGLLAEKDPDYLECLKMLRIFNSGKSTPIIVRKCILSTKKYELLFDPQYDYLRAMSDLENREEL